MDPMPMIDPMTHLTTGAVIVWVLQQLKDRDTPFTRWISQDTTRLNRILSVVAALAVSFGITWTGDASQGWVIHIPPAESLLAGGWVFLKQFTSQEVIYNAAWRRRRRASDGTVALPPGSAA